MSTQSTAKSAIKIIFLELTRWRLRLLRQLPHGLITQQPYANIRQIIMIFQQTAQRFDRRFLKHTLQIAGIFTRRNEHTMVFRNLRTQPQPIANNIRILRNRKKRLRRSDIDIATDYHHVQMTWRHIHDFLIKRHLQRQKCLRQSLSSGPPKNGNRRQNLTRWRIRRQTSALSSGMKQQVFFIFRQRKTSSLVLQALLTPRSEERRVGKE